MAMAVAGMLVAALAVAAMARSTLAADAGPGRAAPATGAPLALDPQNPHYFVFRGKPTVLITSGEHYGAVLNKDFNETAYLDKIQSLRFNLTRVFSGTYVELWGAPWNTLCPAPGSFMSPWQRSDQPGYHHGGNKFDLSKYDDAYWSRLKGFIQAASDRGIVVEYTLFCTSYGDNDWPACPLNASNNTENLCKTPQQMWDVHDAKVMAVEEAFVRKAAAELNGFDNLYFELCNEPYFGASPGHDWHEHMAKVLSDTEAKLPKHHLIAQNIANATATVDKPIPQVSVLNFHYASPPTAVAENYRLQRPIAFDENGFRGQQAEPYGREAWAFLLAGGAVYDGLDWTFSVEHPDGGEKRCDLKSMNDSGLWPQLQALQDFMRGLDFVHMTPDDHVITGGIPAGATAHALVKRGDQVAVHLEGGTQANLVLELPAGKWQAEWVNTHTSAVEDRTTIDHHGGACTLASPRYTDDIALRVTRVNAASQH